MAMNKIPNLDHAQAICSSASAGVQNKKNSVLPCSATLHIGFFFDGFGHNLEHDIQNDQTTNISRLFMVHPDVDLSDAADPFALHRRFYISGIGTDFDTKLGGGTELSLTGLQGALNKAKDNVADVPKGSATDAAVDAGKDILTGKNWWENLLNNLKPGNIVSTIVKAVAPAAIEIFPAIRDNEIAADLFKTGVDTRLEAASQAFEDAITKAEAQSKAPIKRVAVSVFGFDFGATLARAFAHKLFEDCDPGTTRFKGKNLEIVFAGLFDAVDRSSESSIIGDFISPLTSKVDDGECLPGPVKAALHLVAAHECRSTRRSRLIGTGSLTPRWEERLVPGTSYDVGGGLKKADVPYSLELHKATLQDMYRAAYRAGVPFPEFEKLPDIGVKISQLFELNDHVNGISAIESSKRYMAKVGHNQVSAESFLTHRCMYIRRLRSLWQLYNGQYRAYSDEEDRLERPIFGENGSLKKMLGLGGESEAQAKKRDYALKQVRTHKTALRNELGWLEAVDAEARRIRSGLSTEAEKALLNEWFNPNPPALNPDVEDLLELYLNDSYMIGQMPKEPMYLKYFLVRGLDRPDLTKTKGMAPDYLQQYMS
ncbi:phospholipase effector Tle1 domain-containing protein [Pseudomonas chlororaphis]|uniref:phospholipase effector Tle1 domain-containing protein n=1 Tax=Pseudomonas chlororaphis TaxID=587753 RepID=UPI0009C19CFF|nr:DUF2235 domain-containing protein [Pseudomonas chlororaphis]